MNNKRKVLEELYERKARFTLKTDTWKAGSSTFLAATVAWFALYLANALHKGDVVFAIFAVIGCMLLPGMSIICYIRAKLYAVEASIIEANLANFSGGDDD
ncbi:hypothetical protein [Vibrio splendidus]|uniref:hypothetical protein n=1 Tax=Vibrio splendidus TaxID=29497 RepID=UPI00037AE380|nr:hypothetical protein [Vibrio splendidus]